MDSTARTGELTAPPAPFHLIARVLTFRFRAADFDGLTPRHLWMGLAFTWVAGVGRYWDNPRATWWQHLGLGSVAYVFVLSAILWCLLTPMRPARGSFLTLCTFVAAVSPPAILYAVPVERFLELPLARKANLWFLAIVALWRVLLYAVYLVRIAGFRRLPFLVGLLLPLSLIVFVLALLNLEHAVFEIMGGNANNPGTAADTAYAFVFFLGLFSLYLTPVLLILWALAIFLARRKTDRSAEA